MGYKLIVKPEAEQDLNEAIHWYEEQKTGLGIDLYLEIMRLFDLVQANSNHDQKRYRSCRISYTKRFPFGVHYTLEGTTVYVYAILHTKRKPRE